MKTFPQKLKKLLDNNNMTAADLAHLTGISKSTISRYLSGKIMAKQINLLKISQALHINPGELFPTINNDCNSKSLSYSKDEQDLISKYRSLDDVGKATVNAVIEIHLKFHK